MYSGGLLSRLTDPATALKILLDNVSLPTRAEKVGIMDALDRILYEDIVAPMDVPPFDRASMDGYAVRSEDTLGASQPSPIKLKLVNKVLPGQVPGISLAGKEAIEIATGAMMPEGADAVVMYEYSRRVGNSILVFKPVSPGENVSKRGEDIRAGSLALRKGIKLRPWDVGLLASMGISEVLVYRRPKASIISTGAEVIERGEVREGRVFRSTNVMIGLMVKEIGGEAIDFGILPDDVGEIANCMSMASKEADVIISIGGTGPGEGDVVPKSAAKVGKILVRGIAIKPGRPTSLGVVSGKPLIMLSGFPVAAFVGFELFVRPLLFMLQGARPIERPSVRARAGSSVPSHYGLASFVRARLELGDEGLVALPIGAGSGILASLTNADGYILIPEWKEGVERGEEVDVFLLR